MIANNTKDLLEGLYKRINWTHADEEMYRAQGDHAACAFAIMKRHALRDEVFALLYPEKL